MKKALAAVFFSGVLLSVTSSLAQENAATPLQPEIPPAPLPAWLEYKPSYVGEQNDIANPHRTAEEITMWAQGAAADVLSFSQEDYTDKMNEFKKYFVEQGWQPYTAYLQNTKILSIVSEKGYSIGAIVDDVPEIIKQGASDGAYHWTLRLPITVSFFKKDLVTGDMQTGSSGKFFLFIDVLRVAEGGGDNGIAIDDWRVTDATKH